MQPYQRTTILVRRLVGRMHMPQQQGPIASKRLKVTHAPHVELESTSNGDPLPEQRLSLAPMMDYTDLHFRQLVRLMSKNTWLYTEMVVDKTLVFNPDHDRFLWFPPEQHPISCQLGGSDPETLAKAAAVVARYGYDEINLNCGCPSDRVAGAGCFGAALMLRPKLVAECCAAMAKAAPQVPITVKCRIGVDDVDSYESLYAFIKTVSTESPVIHFIIHARKCLLKGLSPHENRTIPPLRYEWVLALKRDFPHLQFSLNGGITTLEETIAVLQYPCSFGTEGISGVMIGRSMYGTPWAILGDADVHVWGEGSSPLKNRRELLKAYSEYADSMVGKWKVDEKKNRKYPSARTVVRPLFGLFTGEPRGKRWRTQLEANLRSMEKPSEVIQNAMGVLLDETLDAPPPRLKKSIESSEEACTQFVPMLARSLPVSGGDQQSEQTVC